MVENVKVIENKIEERVKINEDLVGEINKDVIKANNDNSLLSGWKIVSATEFKIPN